MTTETIHQRFSRLRRQFGSQKDFTVASGLKQSQISNIERGKIEVTDFALRQMENTIRLNRKWLLDGTGTMTFKEGTLPKHYNELPTIGARLKFIRNDLGLTAAQVAAEIGVEAPAVSRYETGKIAKLPQRLLAMLKQKFNVRLDWLYNGEGNPYEHGTAKRQVIIDVALIQEQLAALNTRVSRLESENYRQKARIEALEKQLKTESKISDRTLSNPSKHIQ